MQQIYQDDPVMLQHVVAEAMKLAFADRAFWLGDPDFADVPSQLVAKEYCQGLAKRIDMKKPTVVESHGTPPKADAELFEKHNIVMEPLSLTKPEPMLTFAWRVMLR